MEISRSKNRLKVFFLVFFLTSCQFSNEARKKKDSEINGLEKLGDIFSTEIYAAYIRSCEIFISKKKLSRANEENCQLALKNKNPKPKEVKNFFKENFFINKEEQINNYGIMTGYYEPEVTAYKYKKENTYPLYKIDIKKYGETVFRSTRKEIKKGALRNKGLELAWVENEIEAFFLHIQGSGRLRFPNGEIKRVKYSGSNNKKYTSIGKILLNRNKIKKDNMSMYSIKDWLYRNKEEALEIMEQNERYIFFEEYEGEIRGSAGVSLQPMISIVVDTSYHDLGDILLINDIKNKRNFLGIAHDTGVAIKGPARIDLFTGFGHKAEAIAARLNNRISINKLKSTIK
ncbi:MAG: MltA domain-containing protein [Pseudomonadota bacterium]|nr:MltA domain-containing protein [Pseudomonadota bacterium]